MSRATVAVIVCLTLASCAASSGILPAGPNTYTVTERVAPVMGGGMEAQRRALAEASGYCKSQGREMMPLVYPISLMPSRAGILNSSPPACDTISPTLIV